MLFSDYFNVTKEELDKYGAVNISLLSDAPLFIDPLLVYFNDNAEIREQYQKITKYLLFLKEMAINPISEEEKRVYFQFKEIKNNWLGVCETGNRGLALGKKFANALSERINFVCDTNNVSCDIHVEKMYLVDPGVGKDKISDWTTNILIEYFVDYTSNFAKDYIDPKLCDNFEVQRCFFDYDLKVFKSKIAYLPFIINKKGKKEFVLLTPKSILRVDEQEICYRNFNDNFDIIRTTISNEELRLQIDSLYKSEIKKLYDKKRETLSIVSSSEIDDYKRKAAIAVIQRFPVVYDYFIATEESKSSDVTAKASTELLEFLASVLENAILEKNVFGFGIKSFEKSDSFNESIYRVNYLKNQIECNGVWKLLYIDNKPIKKEEFLQSLFKLVWCRTKYMFSPKSNSGAGPSDFLVSYGSGDSTVIEYKLASNPKLKSVYNQTNRYKKSHGTTQKSIVVVFCFNDKEKIKAMDLKNGSDCTNFETIVIDCDRESKQSASKE